MQTQLQRFEDFHLYGASAPEWNQRYHQISRGTMSSSLLELSLGRAHVFRKSLDRRVVQQGCLPAGQIGFALPARVTDAARMQGREVSERSLFVLREGTEFTLHRPAGMELLAVTFERRRVEEFFDAIGMASLRHPMLSHPVLELPPDSLLRFRQVLEAALASPADATSEAVLLGALADLLGTLPSSPHTAPRPSSAALVVESLHRLALSSGEEPLSVEQVCERLRASRRTLQYSVQAVAQTSPLDYLRALRLNAVRRELLATRGSQAGVGEVAAGWGYSHLGHFSAQYRRLFGESPSSTPRRAERGR